ncbi:MAG: Gfo/Idh/MocA family oxidoreductase [Rothia sp. (in: high G+C Gram-positive bacteria)]|nr:Gfo/Idh/MocA family oxidoreductase [Rothia sp. (in: high G+C Gram-positive bacteria)]
MPGQPQFASGWPWGKVHTMRYGVISTAAISAEFVAAVSSLGDAEVCAVYSRSLEAAQQFISTLGIEAQAYDRVEELCADQLVDAVYIASPNSMHASHALAAIKAGKHVLLEKPAVLNPVQWDQVWGAAQEAGLLVFEAARHVFEPAQGELIKALAGQVPRAVHLNFCQYSSRWDAVLRGEKPNIFSLCYGGGVLVDLGVYAIYDALLWFGLPESSRYFPSCAPTGVDAAGTLLLNYPDFTVTVTLAKNAHSKASSEILLGRQTIELSSIQGIDRIVRYGDRQEELIYDSGLVPGTRSLAELMTFELKFFTQMITSYLQGSWGEQELARYREQTLLARAVNEVCTRARTSAGIVFDAENFSSL